MKRVFVLKVFQAFQAVCIPNVAVTCHGGAGLSIREVGSVPTWRTKFGSSVWQYRLDHLRCVICCIELGNLKLCKPSVQVPRLTKLLLWHSPNMSRFQAAPVHAARRRMVGQRGRLL